MENFECSDYIFDSNFDSGNLGKIEFFKEHKNPHHIKSDCFVNKEFNLWTSPDCSGWIYENTNRTWFYFGVRGGEKSQIVKFNIMNLNRQAKLFSQGMMPVMKIGQYGKWERIKDKPTYDITEDNFILSFCHRTPDDPDMTIYYAFTYPFTYTELQNYLEKLDKKFEKRIVDVKQLIKIISQLPRETGCKKKEFQRKEEAEEELELQKTGENILVVESSSSDDTSNSSSDETPTELIENAINSQFSEQSSSCLDKIIENPQQEFVVDNIQDLDVNEECETESYEIQQIVEPKNEIYYHRELLICSVEGRRVDLLTISSFHGIQEEREERLATLFPETDKLRCNTFENKKIIFVSSRVHPGETPASFVLNGFINLLLDKKSVVAATLRKMYVFKIIPFLNPDGVYNGFYRSDTFGQNLNRVYLKPKLDTQPTIYASKKLLRFYHTGIDQPDSGSESSDSGSPTDMNENFSKLLETETFAMGDWNDLIENNMISSEILQDLKGNLTDSAKSDGTQKECFLIFDKSLLLKPNIVYTANINGMNHTGDYYCFEYNRIHEEVEGVLFNLQNLNGNGECIFPRIMFSQ